MHLLEVLNPRRFTARPQNGEQIESARPVLPRMLRKKTPSSLLDASPLGWSQSLLQIRRVVTGPGLDLNKDDRVLLRAHEVDLSGGATVVSNENAVAVAPQIARGDALAT
jgi:hypothetical protein